jgi:hypothetical protein
MACVTRAEQSQMENLIVRQICAIKAASRQEDVLCTSQVAAHNSCQTRQSLLPRAVWWLDALPASCALCMPDMCSKQIDHVFSVF